MKRVLVGIDDTDNLESRGTGFRARQLGKLIEEKKVGVLEGITRHQLLFDRRIPYTSHNSSACLEVYSSDLKGLEELSRDFLLRESAEGSDAGLAICPFEKIDTEIVNWGIRAKKEILTQAEARDIAHRQSMVLEGLTGTRDGIIGSLAAIGLRKQGNDGRFLWLRGTELRDLKGVYTVEQLLKEIHIHSVVDLTGEPVPAESTIDAGDWVRPVIRWGRIVLIADQVTNNNHYEWKVTSRDHIKSISG